MRVTEGAHDERLAVLDLLCDGVQTRREDHLASTGRKVEPFGSQKSLRMIRYDTTAEAHQRARLAARRDPRQVTAAEPRIPLSQAKAHVRLDGVRRSESESEAVGMRCSHQTGEIDDSEQPAALGIVDGCRGTGPAMDDLAEMLRGMNLHGMVGSKGRPDRVRAGTRFAPERPLDEVHRVGGRRANLRVAVDPQQLTCGVADDDHMLTLAGDAPQALLYQRRGRLEWMSLPPQRDVVAIPEHGWCAASRLVQPDRFRSLPGIGDRQPHRFEAAASHEVVPASPQRAGTSDRRRIHVNSNPWIARHRYLESPRHSHW
ncbi:MAG TPA: hypothetical protein VFD90_03755 [Gaiellales bacterium]|nr:hypothetical protein [Gaiellales bacterium]